MEALRLSGARLLALVFLTAAGVAACSSDGETDISIHGTATAPSSSLVGPATTAPTTLGDGSTEDGLFPDIVDARIIATGERRYDFNVTVSSPYDTDERYADAWRIVGDDGAVIGIRELTHGHPNEQPFTRSLAGVTIPPGITQVTLEGRDILNGWGGETLTVELPTA